MDVATPGSPVSRIANVSAALIVSIRTHREQAVSHVAPTWELLEGLFEDVISLGTIDVSAGTDTTGRVLERGPGEPSAGGDLALVLEAAREERVLVLAADRNFVTAELLLGLTAWPEYECVAPRINGEMQPLCALYQRDVALRALREGVAQGDPDLSSLLNRLDCGVLEGADLDALIPGADSTS